MWKQKRNELVLIEKMNNVKLIESDPFDSSVYGIQVAQKLERTKSFSDCVKARYHVY